MKEKLEALKDFLREVTQIPRKVILSWTAAIAGAALILFLQNHLAHFYLNQHNVPLSEAAEIDKMNNVTPQPSSQSQVETPLFVKKESSLESDSKKSTLEWSYSGLGAEKQWASLGHPICESGRSQSPMDINHIRSVAYGLPLEFNYGSSSLLLEHNGRYLSSQIQGRHSIRHRNRIFQLEKIAFHTPGEHTFEGRSYPIEIQFMHKDAQGNVLILALLGELGNSNPQLAPVIQNAPLSIDQNSGRHTVELGRLLPYAKDYFAYTGSLTTPPCEEGVQWLVLRSRVTFSPQQIKRLEDATGPNARQVQAPYSRQVELHRLLAH